MKIQNLKIMTVHQLAYHLAHSLNYKRIWTSEFPACDFCIIDAERKECYTEDEMENFYLNDGSWHGIKTFDPGFGGNSLFVASDYWGGGNCSFVELYDDITISETTELLLAAIIHTLETNDNADANTLLLVECKGKKTHHRLWMELGVNLFLNETEEAMLLNQCSDSGAASVIKGIVSEGRFEIDGSSYIPDSCIEYFNEEYGTTYDSREGKEFNI